MDKPIDIPNSTMAVADDPQGQRSGLLRNEVLSGGSTEEDIAALEIRVRRLTHEVENSREAETALVSKVAELETALEAVRSGERIRRANYHDMLCVLFLEFAKDAPPDDDSLKDMVLYVTEHRGTQAAAKRARTFLEERLEWETEGVEKLVGLLAEANPRLDRCTSRLATFTNDGGLQLSRLPRDERAYWHDAREDRTLFARAIRQAEFALTVARNALLLAATVLKTSDDLRSVYFSLRTATRNVTLLERLCSDARLAGDAFEGRVNSLHGFLENARKPAPTAPAAAPSRNASEAVHNFSDDEDASDRHRHSTTHTFAGPEAAQHVVHQEIHQPTLVESVYEPAYEYESVDAYPDVNYASGLPMQGGGSMFDVGGNAFGSNMWD